MPLSYWWLTPKGGLLASISSPTPQSDFSKRIPIDVSEPMRPEQDLPSFLCFVLFSFGFAVLGFELRAYTLSHSTSLFCVCYELFAQAGFEP
jgi:hypothetical protein